MLDTILLSMNELLAAPSATSEASLVQAARRGDEAAFAVRVLARLPASSSPGRRDAGSDTASTLGWAALRLMPAALALAALLGWFALQASPPPSALFTWATYAPEIAP